MQPETLTTRFTRATKRIAKIIFLIAGIGIVILFSFYYWGTYDEGVRAGNVLRISKKGVMFKTYEGQLNVQTFGALKGANPIMEAFDFSVESDHQEVLQDLQEVALSGERVNLHYVKRYKIFPWRGDTKYFVTKVERLGNAIPENSGSRRE